MQDSRTIELLAPAKDKVTAIAAITCGADAVYMGASNFGARQAAGNSLADIKEVIIFAHQYNCRVYAAVNTILTDAELFDAGRIIWQLAEIGIDGIIIQDVGLLELDLPDVPIISSTQMNNDTPDKVKFLQDVGFSRAILARELSLEQIAIIHQAAPDIELECFVHGALCVSMSGCCYMSYAVGGRSGNRGCCAQPCRKLYTLSDGSGKILAKEKYLLSIKDLNLSDYLGQLLQAGVSSFKIEGRLKSATYVANVVGFYHQKLISQAAIMPDLKRSSTGKIKLDFEPDPARTFSRGFTSYNITGQQKDTGAIDTPKAVGAYIGKVKAISGNSFEIDSNIELHNGDGICFLDNRRILQGTQVNLAQDRKVTPLSLEYITAGTEIYRNLDHDFNKQLEKLPACRKIELKLTLSDCSGGLELTAVDSDGVNASIRLITELEEAKKPQARENTAGQLAKFGNTIFECVAVEINTTKTWFLPVSVLNQLRRELTEKLLLARAAYYVEHKRHSQLKKDATAEYPATNLDYSANILNKQAETFYHRHGVNKTEPAAESGIKLTGRQIMHTKYCLRKELGLCPGMKTRENAQNLFLTDREGNCFEVHFNCQNCGMTIFAV